MGDFTDRRSVLRSSAVACAAGLAGCLGVLDDSDGSDGNESDVSDGEDLDGNESDAGGTDPEPTLEEWPMFQYDAQNSGHAEGSGPTGPVEVDWTYEAAEKFRGAPAIKDGTVYIGCDDGQLYAFDLEDGTVEWTAPTRSTVRRPLAVVDDVVLASMGDGIDGYDRHSGEVLWEFTTEEGQGATTPVVEDGTVVVGSGEPAVYGIDSETGGELWREEHERNISNPAAIEDGTAYVCDWTNGIHTYDLKDGTPGYSVTIDAAHATGATVANGVIYLGGDDGTLFALDATSLGDELWTFDANDWIEGSPVVSNDSVFFTDQNGVFYSLDRDRGQAVWTKELERASRSAPALVANTIFVGNGQGILFGLDAEKGTIDFQVDMTDWYLLTPALVDDAIVIADNMGGLFSLR